MKKNGWHKPEHQLTDLSNKTSHSDWNTAISIKRVIARNNGKLETDVDAYNESIKKQGKYSEFSLNRRKLDDLLQEREDRKALMEVWD